MMTTINFSEINSTALAVLPAVLTRLFPAGVIVRGEFCIGSLHGEPGRSLSIRLTGSKAGLWKDFAAGCGGSDPVSLVAAKEGVSQGQAARLLASLLGIEVSNVR